MEKNSKRMTKKRKIAAEESSTSTEGISAYEVRMFIDDFISLY
jgi:hypothetical protein